MSVERAPESAPGGIAGAVEVLRDAVRAPAAGTGVDDRPSLLLGVVAVEGRSGAVVLLAAFLRTRSPAERWTLIVADDGSTPDTARFLRGLTGNRDLAVHHVVERGAGADALRDHLRRLARTLGIERGVIMTAHSATAMEEGDDRLLSLLRSVGALDEYPEPRDDPIRTHDPELWSRDPWSRPRVPDLAPSSLERTPPEALVLSLERTPARWVATAGVLAGLGVRFQRVPAVDGFVDPVLTQWREYDALGPQSSREQRLGRRLLGSPGALGYLYSARDAIREARARGLESFLLVDDDVYPHRRAGELLADVLDELPARWKLLHLGGRQLRWAGERRLSPHLYRADAPPLGSYALAIHRSVYDELEHALSSFDSPFDDEPVKRVWRAHPEEVFVAWPPIVLPELAESLIREPRDLADLARGARWPIDDYMPHRSVVCDGPAVSVIVTSAGACHDDVRRSLEGWRHQTEAGFDLTVLVSPHGPPSSEQRARLAAADGRLTFALPTTASETPSERLGRAVAVARGRWIALGDLRTWVSPTFLERAIADLERRGLDLGVPHHVVVGDRLPARVNAERASRSGRSEPARLVLLRRDAALTLGSFTAADLESGRALLQRAMAQGLRCGTLQVSRLVAARGRDALDALDDRD